ncbi:hypothetical protein GCM10007392_30310 [Saccharospirillum salsuginis]|uniref:Uncharacterized protein n=1 Tax=Saccharospirillum salsuginis TaxID=418750 RepID=A0A918KFG1_9GAMM|nr:hypothetical protein GCM10007392_30310 [Saccharospirillum salsuginis]
MKERYISNLLGFSNRIEISRVSQCIKDTNLTISIFAQFTHHSRANKPSPPCNHNSHTLDYS